MGGYHFIDLGDLRLGAAAEMRDRPAHWNLYFNVADMDAAIERVRAGGGTIDMGPHDVPSGARIVLGTDPQHAHFARNTAVAPGCRCWRMPASCCSAMARAALGAAAAAIGGDGAAGVAKAKADAILISGHVGGTGASPQAR